MVKSSQRSTYNTSTICSTTPLISRRRLPESGMQACGRSSEASTFKSKEELVQAIKALHENSSCAVTYESSSANLQHNSRCLSWMLHRHHHLFLNTRVVGAPQLISQPVSSIFPCSSPPSGTWRTPSLSIP